MSTYILNPFFIFILYILTNKFDLIVIGLNGKPDEYRIPKLYKNVQEQSLTYSYHHAVENAKIMWQ